MAKPAYIVALDTTDAYLTVALKTPKGVWSYHEPVQKAAQMALGVLHDLLGQAECTLQQIDCFAVTVGPGRFAGTRSGIAIIQGLAWALDCQVIAIPTLYAWAVGAKKRLQAERVWVCMDARMDQWASQCFGEEADGEPVLLRVEDLEQKALGLSGEDWVLVGTGLDGTAFAAVQIIKEFVLQPEDLLDCAAHLPLLNPLSLEPVYLRPAVV